MPVMAGRSEVEGLRETKGVRMSVSERIAVRKTFDRNARKLEKGARLSVSERIAVRKTFDRNASNGREIGEGREIEYQ